jgi:TRAP transporter TAXI family solute receptor
MRFKTFFIAMLCIAGLFSFNNVTAQEYMTEMPEGPAITIVSGFEGGSYYTMAKEMQKWTKKKYGVVQYDVISDTLGNEKRVPTGDTLEFMEVKDSDGSYYNFLKIHKIDVDVTFLQYDVLLYEDLKDLKRRFKKTEDIRILLPLGTEEIHLITTKDGGIESFKDLKKKRVGIGSTLQGTNITAKFIKEKLGKAAAWEEVEIPYDKAYRLLFNGSIDAFFFVGAAPIASLSDMPKSMKDKLKLISLPQNDDLKDAYGEMVEITNKDYSWVEGTIKTYAVRTVLVTSILGQTPEKEEELKKLLIAIKENKDKDGIHPNWKNVKFAEDPNIEWEYHKIAKGLF